MNCKKIKKNITFLQLIIVEEKLKHSGKKKTFKL